MKRKRDNVKKLSKTKETNVGDDDFEEQPYEQKVYLICSAVYFGKLIYTYPEKEKEELFLNSLELLEVNVVEPTGDEKEELYMVGLIDKGRQVLNNDFEDPTVCASKPSHAPRVSKELSTHSTSSAKAAKGKRKRCCHFNEEITNRLADIQSKQHELASDHVELKLEMRGLRHFVADMFMVVYTSGVDSERKVDGDKDVDRPRYSENDIHGI
ncbi:Uncharacterized protein Adt_26936 [Abeliophyllum distichum]|uniref:Uncharacterized protein n=1 Tax=Abeliophyllum distichum TaxID=126358 RepID=A0ABD1RSK5_9LAMI